MGIASITTGLSQTEQGNIMLGGGASTGLYFDDGYQRFSISLYPNVGYFAIDNLAVGIYMPLGYTKRENSSSLNYGIGPFIRYYQMYEDNMGIFVGGKGGIIGNTYKANEDKYTDWNYYLGLETGVAYFLNESVGLEVYLDYTYYNYGNSLIDARSDNSSLTLNLGFQVYFDPE